MNFKKSLKVAMLVLTVVFLALAIENIEPDKQAQLAQQKVRKAYCVDDYTIEINIREPDATFLARLMNYPIVGGPGPYRIVEYVPEKRTVYEANERYCGSTPMTSKVVELFYTDAAALATAVERGEVDVGFRTFFPEDILRLEKNPNLRVIKGENSLSLRYLGFNVKTAPFDNVHVRRGVSYAIDRERIVALIFAGLNAPLYSMVPPGLWSHIPAFPTRNLAKARENLEAAGYTAANPLRITLWYAPLHYGPDANVASVIKVSLEETGVIQVNINSLEWDSYMEALSKGELGFFLLGWDPDFIDPDNFLSPSLIESPKRQGTFLNEATSEYDKEVFQKFLRLLTDAKQIRDITIRSALYEDSQGLLAESAILIPLWQNTIQQIAITQKNVHGIVLDASMILRNWLIYKESDDVLKIGTTEKVADKYWAWHTHQHIGYGLVRLEPYETMPSPSLAESWEVSEDGTVYTFHLRKDVTLRDGTLFSCKWMFSDLSLCCVACYITHGILGLHCLDCLCCLGTCGFECYPCMI